MSASSQVLDPVQVTCDGYRVVADAGSSSTGTSTFRMESGLWPRRRITAAIDGIDEHAWVDIAYTDGTTRS
jgi:hypothetical protein